MTFTTELSPEAKTLETFQEHEAAVNEAVHELECSRNPIEIGNAPTITVSELNKIQASHRAGQLEAFQALLGSLDAALAQRTAVQSAHRNLISQAENELKAAFEKVKATLAEGGIDAGQMLGAGFTDIAERQLAFQVRQSGIYREAESRLKGIRAAASHADSRFRELSEQRAATLSGLEKFILHCWA